MKRSTRVKKNKIKSRKSRGGMVPGPRRQGQMIPCPICTFNNPPGAQRCKLCDYIIAPVPASVSASVPRPVVPIPANETEAQKRARLDIARRAAWGASAANIAGSQAATIRARTAEATRLGFPVLRNPGDSYEMPWKSFGEGGNLMPVYPEPPEGTVWLYHSKRHGSGMRHSFYLFPARLRDGTPIETALAGCTDYDAQNKIFTRNYSNMVINEWVEWFKNGQVGPRPQCRLFTQPERNARSNRLGARAGFVDNGQMSLHELPN
jgi:hypothetical protein